MEQSPIAIESGEVISIHGAREHNLKNISLAIPRGQFVVVTGVSGSGKSTLAFDLLFAEGQRRFLDSMNVYARQFVEQLARPDVDLIEGIPPAVSIEQRQSRGGGKSTVATVTEIYHFLRLLFTRLGTQYCPQCQVPVVKQTRDDIRRRLHKELQERGDLLLLAPVVKKRKGFHTEVAEWAHKHGYAEVRADGKIFSTTERLRLDRFREHDVEIVVGVLETGKMGTQSGRGMKGATIRGAPSVRAGEPPAPPKTPQQLIDEALELGHGILYALGNDRQVSVHSTERSCPSCGSSFAALDPKDFSYNSPQGWCPSCRGFGELFYLPDVERGARAESIEESWFEWQEGNRELCPECKGTRLNAIARAVRLEISRSATRSTKQSPDAASALCIPKDGGVSIVDLGNASVEATLELFSKLQFKGRDAEIARDILPEIRSRLKFLCEVGLDYLQLGRGATTLSGGEAQRIRLAAQLGSNLSGVLYILDEPTIGLHARDNEKLLAALEILKSRGNSLVVVEHDEETMRRADYIIDLGPGAGVNGGKVVAAGTLNELMVDPNSETAKCLRVKKKFPMRGVRRPVSNEQISSMTNARGRRHKNGKGTSLVLSGATEHNLKDLTVAFPLNRFVCITGVSGSGKSTLIRECLLPALRIKLKMATGKSSDSLCGEIVSGHECLRAVYEVDQSPIGRTPRSVPATYVGFFDEIRQLFASVPEARMRGYSASRFSFNSSQGRCPECQGAGEIKLEMNFLPPAFVRCESCQGTRFNRETLDVEFHGKNIAQVLDLSVAQAAEFFSAFQKIYRPLHSLCDTGLDYVKLGQTSPTLSGGEAQRLKLVTHLLGGLKTVNAPGQIDAEARIRQTAKIPRSGRLEKGSLFILEEPTIGLHMADVSRLVEVLQRLVDAGHSVIVIEHNLDLIAEADWLIDLGPEGGESGGRIVAQGTPEQVARVRGSWTGDFLRRLLA